MAWRERIRDELAALNHFSVGRHQLRASEGSQQLQADLVGLDTLACSFDRLALSSAALAGASVDLLKKTAEALSSRVTYLLEPIQPIEVDPEQCTVQLRSVPPQKDEDKTSYYELLVQRTGEISLMRYQHIDGQGRAPISAHVTREVLTRLVEDFSAVSG
jgi:hypothetical protein